MVEITGQKDDWSDVRIVKEGEETTEGWILNKYLVDQPFWAAQAKTLSSTLKAQLTSALEDNNKLSQKQNELMQQLQTSTDKLEKLEAEYESFKTGAADYLSLKQEYDSTKSALAQAQENVRSLSEEMEDLKISQKIRWFIAGSLVLLSGWVIGVIMGRYQKKRRSHFQV
jgi:SH3 domain protein